mmetsp:Transcript_13099/g.25405  ORF Transcript_13099/g.25405 Transcript_13099/m.25405 type:complete len:225 (-) Transcript_13099:29-703(-)
MPDTSSASRGKSAPMAAGAEDAAAAAAGAAGAAAAAGAGVGASSDLAALRASFLRSLLSSFLDMPASPSLAALGASLASLAPEFFFFSSFSRFFLAFLSSGSLLWRSFTMASAACTSLSEAPLALSCSRAASCAGRTSFTAASRALLASLRAARASSMGLPSLLSWRTSSPLAAAAALSASTRSILLCNCCSAAVARLVECYVDRERSVGCSLAGAVATVDRIE